MLSRLRLFQGGERGCMNLINTVHLDSNESLNKGMIIIFYPFIVNKVIAI